MRTESTTPPGSLGLPHGSALVDALALVEFGPCRDAARPQDWMAVASPMCQHCEGTEDVNFAAARIIAAEYRNVLEILKDPAAVHINLLRGTMEEAACKVALRFFEPNTQADL
jgi:hypothetical protein